MGIHTLGWNDFFKNHYNTIKTVSDIPARIIGVRKNSFILSDGADEYTGKLSGKLYHDIDQNGFPMPVAGDWVVFKTDDYGSAGLITGVIERKNVLSRKASGTSGKLSGAHEEVQVIASNLDIAFIVTGLDRDYSVRRIERYLTLVYNCGAQPVIILNKSDLCPDPDLCRLEVESVAFGVPVHVISATKDLLPEEICDYLKPGVTGVLIGSSGAGKSTIVNRLYGESIRNTRATASSTGKGVHTTTNRDLIVLQNGGMIIDNPGIREVGLWNDGDGLDSTFSDIETLAEECRFSDCSHENEPGCRVVEAVNSGDLDHGRFKSYLKQKKELHYLDEKSRSSPAAIEKQKWKWVAKKIKSMKKHPH